MTVALLVGAGGFLGAIARYLAGTLLTNMWGGHGFPIGTLAVNVAGCLLIGAIAGFAEGRSFSAEARAFLLVGLLGGFTTFSAFGYETLTLVRSGQAALGLLNILGQVALGLAAVWIGYTAFART